MVIELPSVSFANIITYCYTRAMPPYEVSCLWAIVFCCNPGAEASLHNNRGVPVNALERELHEGDLRP